MKLLPLAFVLLLGCIAHAQTSTTPANTIQQWLANLETTQQETFARDVTAPYEAEMAKLAQQYAGATEANLAKAKTDGNLDATLLWRTERDRFAREKNVPQEDEATAPAQLKQLRATWRTQAAKLEKERSERAKTVLTSYDAVLAQAQKQLTQAGRIDDAILLKAKRAELATQLAPAPSPAPAIVAVAEQPKPAVTATPPAAARPATPGPKGSKVSVQATLAKLLAAGADVGIVDEPSGKRHNVRSIDEAPAKFRISLLTLPGLKDGPAVTDADLEVLKEIPAIERLTLQGPAASGAGYKLLADLPSLSAIIFDGFIGGDAAIQAAARNNHLIGISAKNMPISEAAMAAIGGNTSVPNVSLDKITDGLTPSGVAHLARMKKLAALYLNDCPISDAVAAELGKIAGLARLTISKSELTEAGIASLSNLRNLADLQINSPPTTPGAIAAFKKMRSLKSLRVGGQLPADELDKLRAGLKGVEVKS
jgi:hypothetical protein